MKVGTTSSSYCISYKGGTYCRNLPTRLKHKKHGKLRSLPRSSVVLLLRRGEGEKEREQRALEGVMEELKDAHLRLGVRFSSSDDEVLLGVQSPSLGSTDVDCSCFSARATN